MEGIIDFSAWVKLDLRVGKISKVDDIPEADKLYKLEVDLGKEIGKRTLAARLKAHYKKDELKGKRCIVFVNLQPRKMRGIESQGMILAAVHESKGGKGGKESKEKVVLISPDRDIELG